MPIFGFLKFFCNLYLQIFEFLKSDMTWHKPTQSFSSSDNFFKVLWNNALKDELDKSKLKSQLNHMSQFKFNQNDIKAFGILGISSHFMRTAMVFRLIG